MALMDLQTGLKTKAMTEDFIISFIQDGRKKPKKFRHYVRIPVELFSEMLEAGILDPERYYAEEIAFFEFDGVNVTVSFLSLYHSEDFYAKATNYLLIKLMGLNPIERGGFFE